MAAVDSSRDRRFGGRVEPSATVTTNDAFTSPGSSVRFQEIDNVVITAESSGSVGVQFGGAIWRMVGDRLEFVAEVMVAGYPNGWSPRFGAGIGFIF